MRKPDGQTVFLSFSILIAVGIVGYLVFQQSNGQARRPSNRSRQTKNPFDGEAAYRFLTEVCQIGPRQSGSAGMAAQQRMLQKHFEALGGKVEMQPFRVRHPNDGSPVNMANLIVRWHPDRAERVLLCAHYDTRPFPDQDPDPQKRRGVFIGANDGASGVAFLAELGRHMPKFQSRYGVDFVLFDGEEFVFSDQRRDEYFLGSHFFARDYAQNPPPYKYKMGVLFDMVADKHLELFYEKNSMRWRDTRPIAEDIWRTARRLGVEEFIPRRRHEVRDDHLMLRNVGKIPTCDIIDFDYGPPGTNDNYWHTQADTPDKCSASSLAKVGWVTLEWLKSLK